MSHEPRACPVARRDGSTSVLRGWRHGAAPWRRPGSGPEAVSLDERPARFRRGSRWSEPAFLWSVVQTLTMRRLLIIGLAALAGCVQAQRPVAGRPGQPLIIGHRGASAYLPEHTLPAYALAHAQGADLVEPDLVCSRDGVLVCLHDLTLERVTDVAARFPGRARADGRWYARDFDWSELERLTVAGPEGDGTLYRLARLTDALELVERLNDQAGRSVGVIPEFKQPAWHLAEGVDLVASTQEILARWSERNPGAAVVVQCFDLDALQVAAGPLDLPVRRVWNLSGSLPSPADLEGRTRDLAGIGLSRGAFQGPEAPGPALLQRARELGLEVFVWTFRGDEAALTEFLRRFCVDAVFVDDPDVGCRAREAARAPSAAGATP